MVSKKKIKPARRVKTPRSSSASEYQSNSRETDERLLHLALELAHESIGLTSPNPCVGAVIVDSKGQIVGQGSHTFEGVKHADGIRRVVACMQDPNPLVAGKGFERLRNAGVSVATGILEAEAKSLNEAFAKYTRRRTPLV